MEHQQFRELALRELPAVYRMARHLVSDAADVDDLVQQTYLNALRAADGFTLRSTSGIRPWLFKILHNLDRSRRQQRARQPTLIDDLDHRPHATSNGDGPGDGDGAGAGTATPHDEHDDRAPLGSIDWDSIDERLMHAIHALPQRMRSVFLLTAVEGMRYRQVAEILEMPIGTVMSTLSRARGRLLKLLADYAVEQRLTVRRPAPPAHDSGAPGEQNPGVECY